MEAAYLLGGEEALKPLIDPGETVACPLCVRGYRTRSKPGSISGHGYETCFFCKGKGGIQRVVRYLPGFAPGDVPFAPIVKTDSLSCVPSPAPW